jgi:hypothetical protein
MSDTKSLFQIVASELAAALVTKDRSDGEKFVTLSDDAADWMTEAIHCAHVAIDDRLPDDWIYASCKRVADELSEIDEPDDDTTYEIADRLTDTATHTLLTWLASHVLNADVVDQANIDYGTFDMLRDRDRRGKVENPTLVQMLQCGQLEMLRAITAALIEEIQSAVKARESETEILVANGEIES